MEIPVKTEVFEGPLDLLLHLIEKNKIDIYDIPIAVITDQYMEYVDRMDVEDMNRLSEFLVMAATLIDIKCRMLLPKEIDEDGEEIDPREDLVRRLIEYKTYKYMSYELRDMQLYAGKSMFKQPSIPDEVARFVPPVDLDKLIGDLTLSRLNEIFNDVLKRSEERVDAQRSSFGRIEPEKVSLSEKISLVSRLAGEKKKMSFRHIFGKNPARMDVIVTFLAVLELMRLGKIRAVQSGIRDDILIEAVG